MPWKLSKIQKRGVVNTHNHKPPTSPRGQRHWETTCPAAGSAGAPGSLRAFSSEHRNLRQLPAPAKDASGIGAGAIGSKTKSTADYKGVGKQLEKDPQRMTPEY